MGVATSACTNSSGILPLELLASVNGRGLHTLRQGRNHVCWRRAISCQVWLGQSLIHCWRQHWAFASSGQARVVRWAEVPRACPDRYPKGSSRHWLGYVWWGAQVAAPRHVTKIEYFGTYLRYLPTNPTSPHCDNFPTNPRSYPVGSQIPYDTKYSGISMFLLRNSLELVMHQACSCLTWMNITNETTFSLG